MTTTPIFSTKVESMPVTVYNNNTEVGLAAAADAAEYLKQVLAERGHANVILATGNSQLTFLQRHFLDHLHPAAGAFYPVPGLHTKSGEIPANAPELKEYEKLLRAFPADLCALGIGENGHLAFNDPPFADFNDPLWVKTIQLDEKSRRQH